MPELWSKAVPSSGKINIAFIIDTIHSPTAGTEKQLIFLLKQLDRAKFNPFLCVLQSSEWLEKDFSICPLFVAGIHSLKQFKSWIGIKSLVYFLRKERINVVQTFFEDANRIGILAASLAGIRTIISSKRNQGYFTTKPADLLKRLLNRKVTLFIANSRSTKEWAIRSEKIAAEKVEVIYNGLDPELFGPLTDEERLEYKKKTHLPTEASIVGLIANLRPVKGIDVFLRAAERVSQEQFQVVFLIAGDGPERKKLEDLAGGLKIAEKIKFLGQVNDVLPLLKIMDIGVLSSHSESFSNSLLEYMAAGLPVVSTDVGGLNEALRHGEGGYLISVGDHEAMARSILALITNPEMSLAMGRYNRELIKKDFNKNQFVLAHERAYEKLLSRNP
jgi:glycosyltransferase involved in cell wall biosynthesis